MPGLPVHEPVGLTPVGDVAREFRIDDMCAADIPGFGGVIEQVEQPLTHQNVLPQWHRTMFVDQIGDTSRHLKF
jgi:hypothetical protein